MQSLGKGSTGFLAGVLAPWRGLQILRRHPHLWRSVLLAVAWQIVLTLLLLGGWVVLAWHWLAPGNSESRIWAILHYLEAGAVALGGIFFAGVAGTLLGLAFSPLAYTKLAQETERALGETRPQVAVGAFMQTWEALRAAGEFLVVNAVLLLLSLVPGVAPFAAVVSFMFDAWFLGRTVLEYPQVLHGQKLAARRASARKFWGAALGLGCGVAWWSPFPIVGSFLTAAAVAGGVELVTRMETK